MWRRRSDCGWWRKLSRPGCRVSSGNDKARAYARQVDLLGREHVTLPDSQDRGEPYDRIPAAHGDRGPRRRRSPRIRSLAKQSNGANGGAQDPPPIRHNRRRSEHSLAQWLRRARRYAIKTGHDLSPENLSIACWPLPRSPHLFETSLPGVFAVGDVRGGSIKRVASGVGEGLIAISFVHQVLQE